MFLVLGFKLVMKHLFEENLANTRNILFRQIVQVRAATHARCIANRMRAKNITYFLQHLHVTQTTTQPSISEHGVWSLLLLATTVWSFARVTAHRVTYLSAQSGRVSKNLVEWESLLLLARCIGANGAPAVASANLPFFFWASSSDHCLAALDLRADVEQPFDCIIVQNRQAMQSMRRSMDWTSKDNMVHGLFFCAILTHRPQRRPYRIWTKHIYKM